MDRETMEQYRVQAKSILERLMEARVKLGLEPVDPMEEETVSVEETCLLSKLIVRSEAHGEEPSMNDIKRFAVGILQMKDEDFLRFDEIAKTSSEVIICREFNGMQFRIRFTPDAIEKNYVDVFTDDSFFKAHGLSGKKEALYLLGASPDQIRNEKGFPEWARIWGDGRLTDTNVTE